MSILIPLIVVVSYFFFRQIWYHNRKIKHHASLEKIKLSIIKPNVILPEAEIFFKYKYGGGIYTGRGYINMKEFQLPDDSKLYYNTEGIPILEIDDRAYADEEHIESYLLTHADKVSIHIDPVEPYRFEIINIYTEAQNSQNKIQ
jgi:hypothetical protein